MSFLPNLWLLGTFILNFFMHEWMLTQSFKFFLQCHQGELESWVAFAYFLEANSLKITHVLAEQRNTSNYLSLRFPQDKAGRDELYFLNYGLQFPQQVLLERLNLRQCSQTNMTDSKKVENSTSMSWSVTIWFQRTASMKNERCQ